MCAFPARRASLAVQLAGFNVQIFLKTTLLKELAAQSGLQHDSESSNFILFLSGDRVLVG